MFSGHVEIVSVFFMEHPISFSVMVTMKKNPSKTNFPRNKKVFVSCFIYFRHGQCFQSIPAKFVAVA